jgi:hypothetical protein
MRKKRKPTSDSSTVLHGVEEATELLRRLSPRAWLWWFCGSMPFIAALLHFWNSMSRAQNALALLPTAALTLAILYTGMKVAHAYFGDHLLRALRDEPAPDALPWRGRLRLVASQAFLHSTMPWVVGLASVAVVPTAWAYAFYHNVSLLALTVFRSGGKTRDLIRVCLEQTRYRPAQNHGFIMVIFLFGLVVWLNCMIGCFLMGSLSKSITGVENELSRNPWLMLSTAILAGTVCFAWLIVGPVVKALYAVRCFHGMSRKNGEDLLVAFRRASAPSTVLALLLLFGPQTSPLCAEEAAPPAAELRVGSQHVQKSISDVLSEDAFQWRMPRDPAAQAEQEGGIVADFLNAITGMISSMRKMMVDALESIMKAVFKEWLKDLFGNKSEASRGSTGAGMGDSVLVLVKVLLVVLLLALVWIIIRQWRRMPPAAAAPVAAPEINLESDQVLATQLPENEWLKLAQEKIASGDYRLAMRALFLATLAHLGEKKMLSISRVKSNGDYVRELSYRARGREELRSCFTDSVRTFDWAWYGWHEVNREILEQFQANHQRILTQGAAPLH